MAWRPTQYLLEGELDNTIPGKVTGWMRFASLKNKVTFELQGNFHRDIRGAKIRLLGCAQPLDADAAKARQYMDGFETHQSELLITSSVSASDAISCFVTIASFILLSSSQSPLKR